MIVLPCWQCSLADRQVPLHSLEAVIRVQLHLFQLHYFNTSESNCTIDIPASWSILYWELCLLQSQVKRKINSIPYRKNKAITFKKKKEKLRIAYCPYLKNNEFLVFLWWVISLIVNHFPIMVLFSQPKGYWRDWKAIDWY